MVKVNRINISQVEGGYSDDSDKRPNGEMALYNDDNGGFDLVIHDGVNSTNLNKVLGKGKFYGHNADSADGNGYDTIKLIPDIPSYNNGSHQYIVIDPTAPNHVHIRAGGAVDNSSSQLIIGGENSFVSVGAGENPSIYIRSNNNNWAFNSDGSFQFPDSTTQITAAKSAAVEWTSNHTVVDGTRYLTNDIVYSNGNVYKAKADNESEPVTNDTYWQNLGSGHRLNIDGRDIPNIPYPVTSVNGEVGDVEIAANMTWRGEYNLTTSYQLNDLILFNGSTYICISNVTGISPTDGMGNLYWELFTSQGDTGPSITPWMTGQLYMADSIVEHNTILYQALSDNNSWLDPNEEPGTGDNWLVISDTASSIVTIAKNESGSTIPKMSVVYISGGSGNRPVISLSQADAESTSSKSYGVTAEDITDGHFGRVIVIGALIDVDTNTFGVAQGTTLYLSPTVAGGLTTTKPAAPNHIVAIGKIVRNHNNHGVIQINIQNGFELQELHNVSIDEPALNETLLYNDATNLWENKSLDSTLLGDYSSNIFSPYFAGTGSDPGIVYDLQNGFYIKIGKIVHFTIRIKNQIKNSSGTGDLLISGLPFASSSSDSGYATGTVYHSGGVFGSGPATSYYISPSSSSINLTDGSAAISVNNIGSSSEMVLNGFYITD
jgi:hypothetical protein